MPKRPAIPAPSQEDKRWKDAVKQRLELIAGERGGKVDALPETASQAQIIAKVNELLELLQG